MQRVKKANDLVTWVREVLRSNTVRTLDDLKTGVALVQIVHSLNPDAFDLARVDFRASNSYYNVRNLKLLQEVLSKNDVTIEFNIDNVAAGEKRNDLYSLVSYLKHHYATFKERIRSKRALTYDPVVERTRAQERRNANVRPFRVARLAATAATGGNSAGGAFLGGAHSDTASMSDTSLAAFSVYTTLSTRQRCTRMKLRNEVLERWASNVQLPAKPTPSVEALNASIAGAGASTERGFVLSATSPHRSIHGPFVTRAANLALCDAVDFEPIDLVGGSLASFDRWPSFDGVPDVDVTDRCERSGSTPKRSSPTRAREKAAASSWAAFDQLLVDLDACLEATTSHPTTAP